MSAPSDTKLQVNVKTPGGTLLNVYASTTQELDYGLNLLAEKAQAILDLERLLAGAAAVVAAGATSPAGKAVVKVTSPQQAGNTPSCKHGARVYRESKPGAAKKWRAYMCGAEKGTPDQCEPEWIRG
jgi:hypothetical protein